MTRRRPLPRSALLALLPVLGGCLQGYYHRYSVLEPLPEASWAGLRPGKDTLASCLAALGAPLEVYEYQVAADRTSGMALLWYWRGTAGWGFDVSVPLERQSTEVFEMDVADTESPGLVLWFGPDLVLERVRQGLVGELLPGRARPAPVVDG